MRALSNLINLNQPDLVLFVGEALVGNDAGAAGQGVGARAGDRGQAAPRWQAPQRGLSQVCLSPLQSPTPSPPHPTPPHPNPHAPSPLVQWTS